MNRALHWLRKRFHPISYLRSSRSMNAILNICDVPVWVRPPGVRWKIKARLIRHFSTIFLRGGAEPEIYALFKTLLNTLSVHTFWDIGANVGYYTWLVGSMSSLCAIKAFEPEPENIALMQETIQRGELTHVTLRPVAVSDRLGCMMFVRDPISGFTGELNTGGSTFAERHWRVRGEPVPMKTVTIDAERADDLKQIDFIKIDVEGHEEAVVRGARYTIERDQPIILFECFHGGEEITKQLSTLGYIISDAETLQAPSHNTSNYLALPLRFKDAFTVPP